MGWDRGRYYTRSRKVNGRVVREYVGTGPLAELAAQLDALTRADREAEQTALQAVKTDLDTLDADLKALTELTDLVVSAALLAAGFHQHKRGEWRKRRANRRRADCDGFDRTEGPAQVSGACPERRRRRCQRSGKC